MPDIEVEFAALKVGDYAVDGCFLFERKTLVDLHTSIRDGRLFSQACRLAVAPERGVIILEGTAADLAVGGMRREAVQGALIQISVFLGIPLLRARDAEESARLMLYTARQAAVFTGTKAAQRHFPGKRPKAKRRAQLHILQGLPGIGPARAAALLDQFGSVEAVLAASAEHLARAEGIGKHTAEAIRWAVSEPPLVDEEI